MENVYQAYQECIGQFTITRDMGLQKLCEVLNLLWDQIYTTIAKGTADKQKRGLYHLFILQARQTMTDLQWLDDPQVYLSVDGLPQRKRSNLLWISLAGVAASLGLGVWLFIRRDFLMLILLAASLVLMILPHLLTSRVSDTQRSSSSKTEFRLNKNKLLSTIAETAKRIDNDVETVITLFEGSQLPETLDSAARDLVVVLLRSQYASPSDFPIELSSAVKSFLHKKEIEVVDYSPESAGWFACMPSNGERTVEPALLHSGRLLRKGVACVKEGEAK